MPVVKLPYRNMGIGDCESIRQTGDAYRHYGDTAGDDQTRYRARDAMTAADDGHGHGGCKDREGKRYVT
jgi:hypothetical protein